MPGLPRTTKEQRESLVKLAKSHAEKTKVGIRRVRQKGISDCRKKKSKISEDTLHRIEKHVRNKTALVTISMSCLFLQHRFNK